MAATYCTAAEVKAHTNDSALAAELDATIVSMIEQAEVLIDSRAGYWTRYDESTPQARLFPRIQDVDSDGETFIPDAIKHATIAQVEFSYVNAPDRDHGIDEEDKPTKDVISPRAKQFMRGYVKRVGRVTLPATIIPELL